MRPSSGRSQVNGNEQASYAVPLADGSPTANAMASRRLENGAEKGSGLALRPPTEKGGCSADGKTEQRRFLPVDDGQLGCRHWTLPRRRLGYEARASKASPMLPKEVVQVLGRSQMSTRQQL